MVPKILGLVAITILLSAVVVMALSENHLAEAKSQKMSPKHKYNRWIKQVCNDELCAKKGYLETKQYIGKSKTPK